MDTFAKDGTLHYLCNPSTSQGWKCIEAVVPEHIRRGTSDMQTEMERYLDQIQSEIEDQIDNLNKAQSSMARDMYVTPIERSSSMVKFTVCCMGFTTWAVLLAIIIQRFLM
jgi:hypothetical protein